VVVSAGRVPGVRAAWSRVEVHAFDDARRAVGALPPGATGPAVRLELVPAEGSDLAQALAQAARTPVSCEPPRLGGAGTDLEVEIRLAHPAARRVLVLALWGAGVPWPEAVVRDGFAALRLDRDGAMAVGAKAAPGLFPGWTVGIVGAAEVQPDFAAFGLPGPLADGAATFPAGAAPITAPYGGQAPAGEVARVPGEAAGMVVQAFGAGAQAAAAVWAREARPAGADDGKARAAPAHVYLGEFSAKALVLRRLLGPAVGAGGLLGLLGADHPWQGVLSTDGTRLVLEALRAKP
jgi:hypothetical protein